MSELEKLANRILNQVESHTRSVIWITNQKNPTYPILRATIAGEIEALLRELPGAQAEPTGLIRPFRVWFEAYFGFGALSFAGHPVTLEGFTDVGVRIEAYTAADALEQAKLEIPYLIRNAAGGPYTTAIYRIAPDRGPMKKAVKVGPDYCPHLPPCRGQCEGFPIESSQHG